MVATAPTAADYQRAGEIVRAGTVHRYGTSTAIVDATGQEVWHHHAEHLLLLAGREEGLMLFDPVSHPDPRGRAILARFAVRERDTTDA